VLALLIFFFMGLGIGISRLHLAAMSSSCNIFESKENEGEKTSKFAVLSGLRSCIWKGSFLCSFSVVGRPEDFAHNLTATNM
jgi:hypothetical protein